MSQSIHDLLASRAPAEPPEIAAIKAFVSEHTKVAPKVSMGPKTITILMPNAAAAGSLRLQIYDLQQAIATDKKLVIRIG